MDREGTVLYSVISVLWIDHGVHRQYCNGEYDSFIFLTLILFSVSLVRFECLPACLAPDHSGQLWSALVRKRQESQEKCFQSVTLL